MSCIMQRMIIDSVIILCKVHGKNGFTERYKILARYRKVILLNY